MLEPCISDYPCPDTQCNLRIGRRHIVLQYNNPAAEVCASIFRSSFCGSEFSTNCSAESCCKCLISPDITVESYDIEWYGRESAFVEGKLQIVLGKLNMKNARQLIPNCGVSFTWRGFWMCSQGHSLRGCMWPVSMGLQHSRVEAVFRATRIRMWRITERQADNTTNFLFQFEYLVAKDTFEWITLITKQVLFCF